MFLIHCLEENCSTLSTLWHEGEIVLGYVQPLDCDVCCSSKIYPILSNTEELFQDHNSRDWKQNSPKGIILKNCAGQADWLNIKYEESFSVACCYHPWVPATHFHLYAEFLALSAVLYPSYASCNDNSSSHVTLLVITSLFFLFTDKPQRLDLLQL